MNKPNLLYVFADQWRRQAIGRAKADPVITPVMDRFAEESAEFKQAVSCTPLCSPHRAALLTGKYALSTGVYTNCKLGLDIMLSPTEKGIGVVLKEAGYNTGYIGKWHLDLPEQQAADNPPSGARQWDAYTPPGPKRQGFDQWYSYGAFDQHFAPHYWQDSEQMIEIEQWSPEHETDKALAFLDQHSSRAAEQPFALFLSWNPPHSPFDQVPEKYKQLYAGLELEMRANVTASDPLLIHTGEQVAGGKERLEEHTRNYFAAISGLDEQFGRLLHHLQALGLHDNTIVVLTSDHGELLGSHGMMAKHSWHEESVGVPFMLRWPQKVKPLVTDLPLNTVDIMPTLLGLCELPIPEAVQGEILSDLLVGDAERHDDRTVYLSAFPGRLEAIEAFRAAGLDNRRFGWRAVRNKRYAYVVNRGYFPGEPVQKLLYDLEKDPYQLSPLLLKEACEHPVALQLENELAKYLKQSEDTFALTD